MAKKKEKLSLEKMLEQAIVKEEERPYEVPRNWVYFYFTSLIDIQGGTQPPKSQFVDVIKEGYVRLVQIRDFASDKYIVYVPMKKNLRLFNKDDILIARYGASIGRICRGLEGACNVALAKTTFSEQVLNRNYVYWLLKSEHFQSPLMTISRTAQAGFNKDDLAEFKLPLPPIEEQQRIVDTIESIFEKLDTAKELVQNALDSFENRKAVILNKAFTGELTAKWREENGVSLDEWEEKELGKLIKSGPQNGLYKPQTAYGEGDKIVRIDNFYEGVINPWNTLKRLSLDENEKELYKLNNNDILINRVNSIQYLGKSALVRNLEDICVFESNVMRMSLTENVIPEYIIKYLNSARGLKELRKNAKHAVNQASINQTDVKNAIISIPPLAEQKEIVRILDNLLNNEQRAKELCDVIEKIDLMKKAILARAFRGELGTNNPEDESAVELLKEVLKEKI